MGVFGKILDAIKRALLTVGCGEKVNGHQVSSARVLAYLWGLTAVGLSVILVLANTPALQLVAMVGEMLAASLTALGLRGRGPTNGGDS